MNSKTTLDELEDHLEMSGHWTKLIALILSKKKKAYIFFTKTLDDYAKVKKNRIIKKIEKMENPYLRTVFTSKCGEVKVFEDARGRIKKIVAETK